MQEENRASNRTMPDVLKASRPECLNSAGTQGYARDIESILRELFRYHTPRPDQLPKYAAVRSAARYFADVMLQNTPPGADQLASLRKIREAVMTANAAIALDGLSL